MLIRNPEILGLRARTALSSDWICERCSPVFGSLGIGPSSNITVTEHPSTGEPKFGSPLDCSVNGSPWTRSAVSKLSPILSVASSVHAGCPQLLTHDKVLPPLSLGPNAA